MAGNVVALRPSTEGGLTNYDRMKQEIANCDRIDDVKEWENKAKAMAEYNKQSKDKFAEAACKRIRLRAVRRVGELLEQIESEKGKHGSHGNSKGVNIETTRAGSFKNSRTATAKAAGLTPKEAYRATNLARIPIAKFEEEISKSKPPAVDALASLGVKHKPRKPEEQPKPRFTPDDRDIANDLVIEAAMLAKKFRSLKPATIGAAVVGTKRVKLKEDITTIIDWYTALRANV